MSKLIIPSGYASALSIKDTQHAIKYIKDHFERQLAKQLNLTRVSAPLFVRPNSGLNDNLNGVERPVTFGIKNLDEEQVEVVHSLAKWKRMALKAYGFEKGEGLYTDMNAIRRDEDPDNLHSSYVDQWDWELVIGREQRTVEFLKATVKKIVGAVRSTLTLLKSSYPAVHTSLNEEVYFITTQELEDRYPNLSPKAREREIAREHKTVFLMNIGDLLKSGIKHDGRAPDYDDWALNGDLIFWNDVLEDAFELSSMGIRVDAVSLRSQLEKTGTIERMKYPYHQI